MCTRLKVDPTLFQNHGKLETDKKIRKLRQEELEQRYVSKRPKE